MVPLYGIIYYTVLEWIIDGTYAAGDKLPSRAELALRFNTSEDTVRKALSMLLKRGYISMRRGSTPVVQMDSRDAAQRQLMSERYEDRRGTVLDILRSYRFVLPSFLHHAIASLNRAEMIALLHTLKSALSLEQDAFTQASCEIIEELVDQTQNDTLKYYYRTSCLFLRLTMCIANPVLAKKDELIDVRKKLFRWLAKRLLLSLKGEQELTPRYISAGISCYINTIIRLLELDPPPKQGTLCIYYDTQPKYMAVCLNLVERMYAGQFGPGSFLPSDTAVAAEHEVSIPTARKAYKVLNRLGFARTVPQVGTQVILSNRSPADLRMNPEHGAKFARTFLDCLWFWKTATRGAALAACLDVEPLAEEVSSLEARNDKAPAVFQSYYLICLLGCVIKHTGNVTLYSLFELNKPHLLFGLHPLHIDKPEICAGLCAEARKALELLRTDKPRAFSARLANIQEQLYDAAVAFFNQKLDLNHPDYEDAAKMVSHAPIALPKKDAPITE